METSSTKRPHRKSRPQPPTWDGRTNAARVFHGLVADIEQELGSGLTAIDRALVEGFAGQILSMRGMNVRLARGEPVDAAELSQAVASMVAVANRLRRQPEAVE
jgi:hypothetical protein